MYLLNEKIKDLTPYEPISGNYRIRLDANESFLSLPENIKDSIVEKSSCLELNRYPDALASELCAAFGEFYGVDSRCVAVGNGSDELISVIFSAFLMKGDKFASLSQDFSMYDFYGAISEAVNVKIRKNEDFTIDADRVIDTCRRENVKLIIFSNPCNPTSLGLDRETVRRIISGSECLVVLDEAYMEFWDQSLLLEIENYDNLIILKTCSKAFGMAGIRVGFAAANKKLIRVIRAVKSPYNVNSVSQTAAAEVLKYHGDCAEAVKTILASKDMLGEGLKKLEEKYRNRLTVLPSVTNFFTVRTDESEKIFRYLMDKGIVIRFFGDFLRITVGSPEENDELLSTMREYFESMG